MKKFKSIIYSGVLIAAIFGAASCEKRQVNSENGPDLEMRSETMELPDAPKDAPVKKDDSVSSGAQKLSQKQVNDSIIGVWVLKGDSCDSSNGIVFDTGGKYAADGEAGNWHLNGNEIEIKLADASAQPDDELKIKVLTLDAGSAILQRPDGSNVEWKRCPLVPNLSAPNLNQNSAEENAK